MYSFKLLELTIQALAYLRDSNIGVHFSFSHWEDALSCELKRCCKKCNIVDISIETSVFLIVRTADKAFTVIAPGI